MDNIIPKEKLKEIIGQKETYDIQDLKKIFNNIRDDDELNKPEEIKQFEDFFNSDEAKKQIEVGEKYYKLTMDKVLKEIELKAGEGDIESILMLKYKDISSKILKVMAKITNTKELESDAIIKCFDDILDKLDALLIK